jgi:hypothetical protein
MVSLKATEHDTYENTAGSVWLSLFVNSNGNALLMTTPSSPGLSTKSIIYIIKQYNMDLFDGSLSLTRVHLLLTKLLWSWLMFARLGLRTGKRCKSKIGIIIGCCIKCCCIGKKIKQKRHFRWIVFFLTCDIYSFIADTQISFKNTGAV